jgi:hypothetical protein
MVYRHEVIDKNGSLYMSHYRLAPRQSGLFVVEEIARTIPAVIEPKRVKGIAVPSGVSMIKDYQIPY